MKESNSTALRALIGKLAHTIRTSALALLLLLPASAMADPIIVAINDVPNAAPVIQVFGAPNGYHLNTGPIVANPNIEDGALITLFGVNNYYADPGAALPDWSGRFLILEAPNPNRRAVDIVWLEHDFDWFGSGDLRVGFDSAFAGIYYANPNLFNGAEDLGIVTDNWVQVYTSDVILVLFKPHSYRLRN
jgi:hypothetical protein